MKYYLNKNRQPMVLGGNFEVHKVICPYYYNYANWNNFIYLGEFNSEFEAIIAARWSYGEIANDIDGCAYCCSKIHKK